MERPLCVMRETSGPGLRLEPSKDVAILWTPDAAAAYLTRAAPLVIAQVAVSAKDTFDALFAATSGALIARLSTDPLASELYRACDFNIQYLLHGWVRSQNVEYGVASTRQQLVI